MSDRSAPKLNKWPFLLGDLLLVGLAVAIVFRTSEPLRWWEGWVCLGATLAGAWFCTWPFLREYAAGVKLSEADALASTVAQIKHLERIQTQMASATEQWQAWQQHSAQSVAAAKELAERMKAERTEFCSFLQKTSDAEKNHLRLEVEKLRRGERDWLQAMVTIFDHVFALHMAGVRSGQPGLAAQLNQFHSSCRDAARRMGLVGFAPGIGDPFDGQTQQAEDSGAQPGEQARVTDVLALGFTFRGELVRRALVKVGTEGSPEAAANGVTEPPLGEGAEPTQAEAAPV